MGRSAFQGLGRRCSSRWFVLDAEVGRRSWNWDVDDRVAIRPCVVFVAGVGGIGSSCSEVETVGLVDTTGFRRSSYSLTATVNPRNYWAQLPILDYNSGTVVSRVLRWLHNKTGANKSRTLIQRIQQGFEGSDNTLPTSGVSPVPGSGTREGKTEDEGTFA